MDWGKEFNYVIHWVSCCLMVFRELILIKKVIYFNKIQLRTKQSSFKNIFESKVISIWYLIYVSYNVLEKSQKIICVYSMSYCDLKNAHFIIFYATIIIFKEWKITIYDLISVHHNVNIQDTYVHDKDIGTEGYHVGNPLRNACLGHTPQIHTLDAS